MQVVPLSFEVKGCMKHLIIIPAYNEEENIERLLGSLKQQTVEPTTVVVVNDGSSDNTLSILKELEQRMSNLSIVNNTQKRERQTGAKIVRAFNLGLASIDVDSYDLISKFDADLEFPSNYLSELNKSFQNNPKLGLAGGGCEVLENGQWKYEKVAKDDHVRGALKTYRVSAFKMIDGLPKFMGWDSADEFLLRYNNWEVKLLPKLRVKHYRPTNQLNGWQKSAKLNAEVYHNLSYGFVIGSLSALKRGLKNQPIIISGILTWIHFVLGYLSPKSARMPKSVGKFIRRYRWKSMFN